LVLVSDEPSMVKRFEALFEQLWDSAEPADD
jgi:hypothetical protein